MTPEKQRIAIAKACGMAIFSDGITHDLTPCSMAGTYCKEGKLLKRVPDYLNDLNAMHEAEKVLFVNIKNYALYRQALIRLAPRPIHTTASQRAEAFLRTIGKWEE